MKKNLLFLVAAVALVSCGNGATKLSGAGATFPAPFYNIVLREFTKVSGTEVAYGGIGSSGGVRSLADKTVDFGATDVFLSNKEMEGMGAEVIHVPTALGAVVLSYNLEGVTELRLTPGLVSAIFRGEVTQWNDERIREVNPGQPLPAKGITPVFRSDGSGTTAVFSEYMSAVDPAWNEAIGAGKSLNFPAGIAAKGNPGVAGIIAETAGAIGYIGSEYALALNIPSALLQNSAGHFMRAEAKSISASANIGIPDDTRVVIYNSPNPEAYPISTFTWIIAYKEQNYNGRAKEDAKALAALLDYIIGSEGQDIAVKTHYAPLPPAASGKAAAAIRSMTFGGQPVQGQEGE